MKSLETLLVGQLKEVITREEKDQHQDQHLEQDQEEEKEGASWNAQHWLIQFIFALVNKVAIFPFINVDIKDSDEMVLGFFKIDFMLGFQSRVYQRIFE